MGWRRVGFAQPRDKSSRIGNGDAAAELFRARVQLHQHRRDVDGVQPPERNHALRQRTAAEQGAPPPTVGELAVEPVARGAGQHLGGIVKENCCRAFRHDLARGSAGFSGENLQLMREFFGGAEQAARVAQSVRIEPGGEVVMR